MEKSTKIMIAAGAGVLLALFFTKKASAQEGAPGGDNQPTPGTKNLLDSVKDATPRNIGGGDGGGGRSSSSSSVMNRAESRPATPREKQLGLNWLQALVLKNGNTSIYTPFTDNDLAANNFGPKSRAALAKATDLFSAAVKVLPSSAVPKFIPKNVTPDAVLQVLVDAVTLGDKAQGANSAELQALVTAAGGTLGSIAKTPPAPTKTPATNVSPLQMEEGAYIIHALNRDQIRGIARFCNAVADAIDNTKWFDDDVTGLRLDVDETELTPDHLARLRNALNLFTDPKVVELNYVPADVLSSMKKSGDYTTLAAVGGGGYAARLNWKPLNWAFSQINKIKDSAGTNLANALLAAYANQKSRSLVSVPDMELSATQVKSLIPNKKISFG